MEINEKIKNNAISSYFLFIVCIAFLLSKNEFIKNDFVKKHTITAFTIHIFMILDFLVFKFFKIFGGLRVGYSINSIVFSIILIFLFLLLFLGVYKAKKGEDFKILSIASIKKEGKLFDIDKNGVLEEKDKITLILSYIPFVGQILNLKYENNLIKQILRLNIFISFILALLFIYHKSNISSIFTLIYMIFVAFIGVNLIGTGQLVSINLSKYFSFSYLFDLLKITFIYFKNYLTGKFVEFKTLENTFFENKALLEAKTKENLANLNDLKGPKKLIYIPIINFIYFFMKENKYKIHIRNGFILSFLFILAIILIIFKFIGYKTLILFLFPISFGIGSLYKVEYKMPFVYDIYEIFIKFKNIFSKSKKYINEKKHEVHEVNLKVGEKVTAPIDKK